MRLGHGSMMPWWYGSGGSPIHHPLGNQGPWPMAEIGAWIVLLGLLVVLVGVLWHLGRQLQAARRTLQAYEVLDRLAAKAIRAEDRHALLQAATEIIGDYLAPVHHIGILLHDPTRQVLYVAAHRGRYPPAQSFLPLGQGIMGRAWRTGQAQRVADVRRDPDYFPAHPDTIAELDAPIPGSQGLLGIIGVESPRAGAFDAQDEFFLTTTARLLGLALETLEQRGHLRERVEALGHVFRFFEAMRNAKTRLHVMHLLLHEAMALTGAAAGALFLAPEDRSGPLRLALHAPRRTPRPRVALPALEDIPAGHWAATPDHPLPEWLTALGDPWDHLPSAGLYPLPLSRGILALAFPLWEGPTAPVQEALTLMAEAADNALLRVHLHGQLRRQVRHLRHLRAVDQALTARLDRDEVLRLLLRRLRQELHVTGAAVFGFPLGQEERPYFRCLVAEGHVAEEVRQAVIGLDEVVTARHKPFAGAYIVRNLSRWRDPDFPDALRAALTGQRLRAFAAFPLVVQGKLRGQLEVFHKHAFPRARDWWERLQSYVQQAAVILDHTATLHALERKNRELEAAFVGALRAWERTLGLRSQATEGHGARVAELALALGQALGLSGERLHHLYWGGLLHDLGKIGIPDAILLKPGPLTEEEFALVRQHPLWGYEILKEIPFIPQTVLNAVRYHHERWDGQGYPEGLKRWEIPLEARILAVADVWDALTSDRPYRPAYSPRQACEYIRAHAGKQFDPRVVRVFLGWIKEQGGLTCPEAAPHSAVSARRMV